MQVFKDSTGHQWTVEINVNARKKVLADTSVNGVGGVDLFAAIDGAFQQQVQDPAKLVAVLYSLCETQAAAAGITPEQFAARFVGDSIEDASGALMRAIVDFFPSRQREVMTKALAKGMEVVDLASKMALDEIDKMDAKTLLQQLLNGSAGNSPGSPPSAPALTL